MSKIYMTYTNKIGVLLFQVYIGITIQGAGDCCYLPTHIHPNMWITHMHNTLTLKRKEHQRAHPNGYKPTSHHMAHILPPLRSASFPGLDHICLIRMKICPWLLLYFLGNLSIILNTRRQIPNNDTKKTFTYLFLFSFVLFLSSFFIL